MEELDELDARYLRSTVPAQLRKNAVPVTVKLERVLASGTLIYSATAVTTKDVDSWKVKVKLLDLSELMEIDDPEFKVTYRARLAVEGNIRIECSCKAFLYWGHRWRDTALGSVLGRKEYRAPVRNIHYVESAACKHLYAVLDDIYRDPLRVARAMAQKMGRKR